MEQEVVVDYCVKRAVSQHQAYVLVQLLVDSERMCQLVYKRLLLWRQLARVGWRNSREAAAFHRIFLTVYYAYAPVIVNFVQQYPVLHVPLRVAVYYGSLNLELDHGYRLVHLGRQPACLVVNLAAAAVCLGHELLAWVVAVMLHGKRSQRYQVYAVSLLKRNKVGIAQRQADDVAHAGGVARAGTHPQYVVVAPLYVPVVVCTERVHYVVRPGTTVVNVAKYV